MDDSITSLTSTSHPVHLNHASAAELRCRLAEVGFLTITLPNMRHADMLTLRPDRQASDLSALTAPTATGTAHLEGDLLFNATRLRCVAEIDPRTLRGTARLTAAEPPAVRNTL